MKSFRNPILLNISSSNKGLYMWCDNVELLGVIRQQPDDTLCVLCISFIRLVAPHF